MSMRASIVVVGGGITGMAAARRLQDRLGPGAVALVEEASRLGGKIVTERRDGFVLEGGPDCFLGSKPAGVALCRELGLEDRLIGTDPAHRRSFVKRAGRLHPLPDGISGLVPSRIAPLLTTGILSLGGRLRAGLEPLVPRRRGNGEESVGDFVRRRFGREAWEWLVEPLLSGIYAGDGDQMSLAATFPQLQAMEREHGSLLRPMLAARFRRADSGTPPRAGFLTLPGGLGDLVEALATRLGDTEVLTGRPVRAIRAADGGYRVVVDEDTVIEADGVLLATPAHVSARLVRGLDPVLAQLLEQIPLVSTATVSVAFRRADVPRVPRGYGYISPRAEGGPIVACTCTSNKFPTRAPDDTILLRCFVGRAGADAIVFSSDADLVQLVRDELGAVLGLHAEPLLTRVVRWPNGLPQYTLGHAARRDRIASRLAQWPGLLTAGASHDGVGIPDCIASGWQAADHAVRFLVPA